MTRPELWCQGEPEECCPISTSRGTPPCGLLIHFTAPTVHAGFKGTLTLEMKNLGQSPILLYMGEAVCQLILEVVEDLPFENQSQFQGQTTPPGAPRR